MLPQPARVLDHYLRHRRAWEVGLWAALWMGLAFSNSFTAWMDVRRRDLPFDLWEPVTWEFSSCLVLLALVPAVIAFERRFPLQFGTWRRNLPWHLLGSFGYSVVHVLSMIGLRKLAYISSAATRDCN